jgi:glutamate-5-semialdehyde dehydrogenase
VDNDANLDMAKIIVDNAKTQRPGVCNAMESLLIHVDVAESFLPAMADVLLKKGVELRLSKRSKQILNNVGAEYKDLIKDATEEDWATEYEDLILSVKIVDSLEEAIAHINKYGSRHSDAIVTDDSEACEEFLNKVDAAAVYCNASTRFTDGFEFGFGAEIGNSNQKLHARGPIGLEQLTSEKYTVYGSGQIRG